MKPAQAIAKCNSTDPAEAHRAGLAAVFQTSHLAISIARMSDGCFVDVNSAFERLFGYAREETIGRTAIELGHWAEPGERDELLSRVRAGEEVTAFRAGFRRRSGEPGEVQTSARIVDVGGEPHLVAILSDITEQTRRESELREREARYRAMLESTMDGFWVVDRQGRILDVNDRYCRRSGYSREELLAMTVYDIDAEHSEEQIRSNFAEIESHVSRIIEVRHRAKDGSVWSIEVSTVYLPHDGGRFYSFLRDITQRKQVEERLRQSELRYRLLFESANDGIFIRDQNGFVDCNERGARMYGTTREALLNHSPGDFAPEHQRDGRMSSAVAAEKMQLALAGMPQRFEWKTRRADGGELDVEVSLNKVTIGDATYVQAVVRDISERRRFEDAQATLAAIVQNTDHAIVGRDLQHKIISWNPGAERILGYKAEEVMGTDLQSIFLPQDRMQMRENRAQMEARNSIPEVEGVRIRKDGRLIDVSVNLFPIKTGSGVPIGSAIILRDITERKRYEQTQAKLAAIVQHMSETVIGRDPDGKVTTWNPAAERLFGYTAAEIVGTDARVLRPADDCLPLKARREEIMTKGTTVARDAVRVAKDGTRIDVSVRTTGLWDGAGNLIGTASIMRDIRERVRVRQALEASRKVLEQRVADRTRELARAHDRLRALVFQLNSVQDRERRMLALELHDNISQLLVGMSLKLHAIQEGSIPRNVAKVLKSVAGNIDQVQKTVRSITFQLSPPALSELGLVPAIERLAEELKGMHGIRVDVRARDVPNDISQLARSVLYGAARELLVNVVKHARVRSAEVDIRRAGTELLISVADRGIGIDKNEVGGRVPDSGFGLLSMGERLRLVGGDFSIESGSGAGTLVTLRVPLDSVMRA